MTGQDVIAELRESRRLFETWVQQKGEALYAGFTKDERILVQFGMFPAGKMEQADKELLAEFAEHTGVPADNEVRRDIGRLLAVAIMDAANRGPDKMVV